VVHVTLVEQQRLCIAYKNDHDFVYISPVCGRYNVTRQARQLLTWYEHLCQIAPQIVQEILERVDLVRDVDRKRLAFSMAEKYRATAVRRSPPCVVDAAFLTKSLVASQLSLWALHQHIDVAAEETCLDKGPS